MKQSAIIISIIIIFAWLAYAGDSGLPPHLEIVDRDGVEITVRDKNTGEVKTVICEGEPKFGPGWELDTGGLTTDITDSCFYFWEISSVLHMGYMQFGDADNDSLAEIIGVIARNSLFHEYSPEDSIYILTDTLYDAGGWIMIMIQTVMV